jgi:hypothetical protein
MHKKFYIIFAWLKHNYYEKQNFAIMLLIHYA